MTDRYVIDASVAVKWFIQDREDHLDMAREVLNRCLSGGIELHAPWNFVTEVCAQLVKATQSRDPGTRIPRLTRERAFSCARYLLQLPIVCAERKIEDIIRAIALAIDGSKSYYDMCYLGLAERLNCRWCTADLKVLEAVPPSFPVDRILPLSSF